VSSPRLKVFISSVQRELQAARAALKSYLLGDSLLRRFVAEVFLFEDLPASDRRVDEVYLGEVERCDVYLGIFGYEYGSEDAEGVSPTEREFDHATLHRKVRLVYLWGREEHRRSPKVKKLIEKVSRQVIRRHVDSTSALTTAVYDSLVEHLDRLGALQRPPFDTAGCVGASLADLADSRLKWFVEAAESARRFTLPASTSAKGLLRHLALLAGEQPTNAAVLLFGANPQRFHRAAEAKCVHCHGTEYRRPFASQQVYGGDLFEQADQARDFVLAKVARGIGLRTLENSAQVAYELPAEAVGEAIINALVHRDYHGHGSVEVRLFADRLEVWNPGSLPSALTFEQLREDHPSIPNNPHLANAMYLARYIEKAGSGTQEMIAQCRAAGLPEPEFEQREGFIVVTLWRDRLTAGVLASLGVSPRQALAVALVKRTGRIANAEYQEVAGVHRRTAARELDDLVEKGVFERRGEKRGAHYVLAGRK
jgi:ATP-dependent DNA helicase RecG